MASLTSLIPGFFPPSTSTYKSIILVFSFFPFFALLQFLTPWYPMGKTALASSMFNLPGRLAWVTMEVPGMSSMLYVLWALPQQLGLIKSAVPSFKLWADALDSKNLILASLFVTHYVNRAIISPIFLNPHMSNIHLFVWFSAAFFQFCNGISIGAWLGGYGPRKGDGYWDKPGSEVRFWIGVVIWFVGFIGNIYHDELLRNLRRPGYVDKEQAASKKHDGTPARSTRSKTKPDVNPSAGDEKDKKGGRVYHMPSGGLFEYVLYAHYLLEWVEWIGFWIAAGPDCAPARNFVMNEVLSMGPRAWNGRNWYLEKFGAERVGKRKAIIPWLF
jgi:3-oxo-5-alpha-steroid 4-dehydrogenase 1